MNERRFEIWVDHPTDGMKRTAELPGSMVAEKFHNMKVGEQLILHVVDIEHKGTGTSYIRRVQDSPKEA